MDPFFEQFRARIGARFAFGRDAIAGYGVRVEKTMRVGGLVQVIAQAVLQFFGQKFQALPGGHDLRVEFFQILFQRSGLSAKVIQLPLRLGG